MNKSSGRTLEILEYFVALEGKSVGVSEISRAMQLPKSSDILFSHDITMQMRTLFTKGSTDVASKLESLRSSQDTRLRNNMEKLREIQ